MNEIQAHDAGNESATSEDRPPMGVLMDWTQLRPNDVYRELPHPADLFLEVTGDSLAQLCAHALFALFHNLAELSSVQPVRARVIEVIANNPADVVRRLLSEALVIFYTERFLAVAARVKAPSPDTGHYPANEIDATDRLILSVELWGETIDPQRHELLTEIKAVTRHQLSARPGTDGMWSATILLDV